MMARESFESEQTAGILNENFICIKVDREERPDPDEIYMKAVRILAGTGGCPYRSSSHRTKNRFMVEHTSRQRPVRDLPAFNDILQAIVSNWHDNREQLQRSSEDVTELCTESYLHKPHSGEVSVDLLDNLYEQLVLRFDPAYGGFGAEDTTRRLHAFRLMRLPKGSGCWWQGGMVCITTEFMQRSVSHVP
jgi:uncharacterized protein YyaL (SSP411 family)